MADSIDAQAPAPGTAAPEVTGVPKVSARALERAGNSVEAVASPPRGCRDAAAKDAAASFLGPTCRSGKSHLRHAARTGNRVATVIVGSMAAPVAATEAEPVPTTVVALEPTQASAGAAAKSILTPVQPTVGRGTPTPKKRKAVGVRLAHLDSAGINAYAAVPWSGREDRGRHPAHAVALQFNYAGPFGGIQ